MAVPKKKCSTCSGKGMKGKKGCPECGKKMM